MATITLSYDGRNTAIRDLIAALVKLDGIKAVEDENGKKATLKAIEEARNGKTKVYKSMDEFRKMLHEI